jgi:formamidopyrimidine-DNA glycosylase
MPELPEVETVVRGLTKHIIGQTINDVEVLHKKSFLGKKPTGLKIKGISRRGKGIIIELTKDTSLLIHLKMTGQLIYISGSPIKPRMTKKEENCHAEFSSASKILKRVQDDNRLNFGHPTDDFTNSMPSKHTRVIFKLSGGTLYFNDQRIFGWIKALPTKDILSDPFIKKLGPEPFLTPYTMSTYMNGRSIMGTISIAQILGHLKRRPKSSIKATLLDQSVLTGLGNIYVDEILFEAGIRPTRKSASITKLEAEKLVRAIKKILKKGIKHSGTSIINYKTPEGSMGRMQNYLQVYMQEKNPCKVCKSPILKTRVAGRGTHFCKTCQK